MPRPAGHGRRLSYYDFGRTTVRACQADPRFSYCAYVPESYEEDGAQDYPLLVAMHGTGRMMELYRDSFAALAEARQLIVLAPLFPAGITGPEDLSSYKMLRAGALHYDAVLLSMVEEMRARYRIRGHRFSLFGFSGGGHFAHRFLYLHPDRLSAVSIGAPGLVTLLDEHYDFWPGVRDWESRFGQRIDIDAMRDVAVQMVVGGDDTDTWEITIRPGDRLWMPGADAAGANRQDRLRALRSSLEAQRIAVRHDTVPGVAHWMPGVAPAVIDFFTEHHAA